METYQYMAIVVFSVFSVVLFYFCVYKEMGTIAVLLFVDAGREQENDDDVAIDEASNILEDAEESIEIYDNGNQIENSLYNDPGFINSVREKLESRGTFRVRCFFNFDEGLDFTKAFATNPQVQIFVRKEGSQPDEVHYKIIDGGKKAYLSVHKGSDDRRIYKEYDCSRLGRLGREKAYDLLFGDKVQDKANFSPVAGV